jgi:hypothetical protein
MSLELLEGKLNVLDLPELKDFIQELLSTELDVVDILLKVFISANLLDITSNLFLFLITFALLQKAK